MVIFVTFFLLLRDTDVSLSNVFLASIFHAGKIILLLLFFITWFVYLYNFIFIHAYIYYGVY